MCSGIEGKNEKEGKVMLRRVTFCGSKDVTEQASGKKDRRTTETGNMLK